MRKLIQQLSAVFVTLALPCSAWATTWLMATGYPDHSFFTKNIRQFAEEVEQKSEGRLKIDVRSNDTLIKHDAIKRAVQKGQVPIGEIRLGVYGNENEVFNLDGLPDIASNYEEADLLAEARQPFFDELFGKQGMRMITYVSWPGQGFYTQKEIKSLDDLKGAKMRIYSRPTQKMGEMLGAEAVILPFAEVAQAFATGLINSQFTSAQTGIDTQAWDNVSHFMYTGTLHNQNAILVNEAAFQKLDEDLQEILIEAGKEATKRGNEMSRESNEESLKTLEENGMKVTEAPADVKERLAEIGEAMIEDWRKEASDDEREVLDNYLELKNAQDS